MSHPPSLLGRLLWLALVVMAIVRGTNRAYAAPRKPSLRACLATLAELGHSRDELSPELTRALVRANVDPRALHEHVLRVYLSMTGRGRAERLDIHRLAGNGMNSGEEVLIEGFAYRLLERYARTRLPSGRPYSVVEAEIGEAPELNIVTHLTVSLQRELGAYLDATERRSGLRRRPWLFLVDPATADHLTPESGALASLVEPSRGGELGIELGARTINVMGGFIDDCVPKTIHSASTASFRGPIREVDVRLHVPMIYHGEGESLAVLRRRDTAEYIRLLESLRATIIEEYAGDRHRIDSLTGARGDGNPYDYTYVGRRSDGKQITIHFIAPP